MDAVIAVESDLNSIIKEVGISDDNSGIYGSGIEPGVRSR